MVAGLLTTMKKALKYLTFSIWAILSLIASSAVQADTSAAPPYFELNLNYPQRSHPLIIAVRKEDSLAHGWKSGSRVTVRASVVRPNGKQEWLRDAEGRRAWAVRLDANGEGLLTVVPALDTYTGCMHVTGNGKLLKGSTGKTIEKIYEYRFKDGARVKVHFTDQVLEKSGESAFFGKDVLDAATQAYQTITEFNGFNTTGFSFAKPDKAYAYDPDSTIDVYLGDPATLRFKDAPCFDTLKAGENRYEAVILLPANYKDFIRNWERINPSPLGKRNVEIDLRGTLIHEMLHVVLFYYNKNLNKEDELVDGALPAKKRIDWYVEGLARYFETFGGARHDFFSQGFKQTLPDKIRFSRGGSNYYMRYPDQAFIDLRYENALFWRFVHYRYGMEAIEKLSRDFRLCGREDFEKALERATGASFKELLRLFSLSILTKDFGLKDDSEFLREIAMTRLTYRNGELHLPNASGGEATLGLSCRTDWIARWEDVHAEAGGVLIAGDNTEKSDVSGWATDFYEIKIDSPETLPWLGLKHEIGGGVSLTIQLLMVSKGGSTLTRNFDNVAPGATAGVSLKDFAAKNGFSAADIDKVFLLITNTDPKTVSEYEILVRP
jgi:hypothetical protein